MTPPPKRRWPRFTLRTLFVVVTMFGVWLGWNVKQVRERERFLTEIPIRGGTFDDTIPVCSPLGTMPTPPDPVPLVWSWLGARSISTNSVSLPSDRFSPDEIIQIRRLLPEVMVGVAPRRQSPATH